MKTLKVEEVYLMEYDTFEDVAASLPRFIDASGSTPRLDTGAPLGSKRSTPGRWSNPQPDPVYSRGCTPRSWSTVRCRLTQSVCALRRTLPRDGAARAGQRRDRRQQIQSG